MSILTSAKIDFKVATRSPMPWATTAVLILITGLITYVHQPPAVILIAAGLEVLYTSLAGIFGVMLPLIILLLGFAAIAGDRDTHRINLYLSHPNSRADVYVGKLVSRFLVLVVGLATTFFVIGAATYLNYDIFLVEVFVGLVALTFLYAAGFFSITMAITASSTTQERSLSNAIAVYFVLVVVKLIPVIQVADLVKFLHVDVLGRAANVDLYNFVEYLNPFTAYQKGLNLVLSDESKFHPFLDSARNIDQASLQHIRRSGSADPPVPELPTYLTDEFALVILALWIVIPLVLGYWAFDRADLM